MGDPTPQVTLCRDCGTQPAHKTSPMCVTCQYAAMERGMCKWCGVRPKGGKSGRSKYCVECGEALSLAQALRDRPDEPFRAKWRGRDARENQYETRGGG